MRIRLCFTVPLGLGLKGTPRSDAEETLSMVALTSAALDCVARPESLALNSIFPIPKLVLQVGF